MNLYSHSVRAVVAIAAFCIAAASPAAAEILRFEGAADGAQEVADPPVMTDAFGFATVLVDTDTQNISLSLDVTGISLDDLFDTLVNAPIGPVHLHNAGAGSNGPVVIPFAFNDTDYNDTADGFSLNASLSFADAVALSGSMQTFNEFLSGMISGLYYVNVHTDTFNGGEVRGQLQAVPLPGAMILFAAGALALGAVKRKRTA